MAYENHHGKQPFPALEISETVALQKKDHGESRRPRALDALVEELKLSQFRTRHSSDRRVLRVSSLLRFSLNPTAACTTLFSRSPKHTTLPCHTGTIAGLAAQNLPLTSEEDPPGLEPDSAAAQGIVSMPGRPAPSPAPPAVAPGTTTAARSATQPSSTPGDPKSSKSTLRSRKSASQLAQRLSSWSGASSSSSTDSTNPNISNKAGSKLRSVSSSDSLRPGPPQTESQRASFLRRLSPGLAARVKQLDGSNKSAPSTAPRTRNPIGKIPEEHIQELDRLHQDLSIKVHKKGTAWSGGDAVSGDQLAASPSSNGNKDLSANEDIGSRASEARPSANEIPSTSDLENSQSTAMNAVDSSQTMAMSPGMTHGTGTSSPPEQTDFEKYLQKSTEAANAPRPPPKDSPPPTSGSNDNNSNNADSQFTPLGLHRTDSIYSFSRASFSNQLSQLTSISLPQPSTLEATISSIATAPAAVRALTGAAEQIQKWIDKASDVLGGLDAEDDVEWAAAGGREGLDEVDKAVTKFESLVNVYVQAIENVQLRDDIADVGPDQLNTIVTEMETTLKNWTSVRSQLKGVKEQVELAMEWEELWSQVLGDVGLEIDNLSRLIFEMEEKRHKSVVPEGETEPAKGLDINELETIVEESPASGNQPASSRLSMPPMFPPANTSYLDNPASSQDPQDESSLLALFARMQPLRASLDFLPMRLSMFNSRAEKIFPSACEELDGRRESLDKGYKKLESDSEALRRELGEDRWIVVFRNAGKQAHKMCESVERGVTKLQEAIEGGIQHNNPAALAKRADNFEAKKVHYGSAIERVLFIIQKGINDRLTVNGEIIRLHADLKSRSDSLQSQMRAMDSVLDDLNAARNQELRDSMSSIVTVDSPATRSAIDTPESSPASSVVMSAGNGVPNIPSRRSSATSTASKTPTSKLKRYSGLPQPASDSGRTPRRSSVNRTSTNANKHLQPPTTPRLKSASPSPAPTTRPASRVSTSSRPPDNRPAWNSSANTRDLDVGHNFKPLSATTPSPHRKMHTHSPRSLSSSLPIRSPLSRDSSASPAPGLRPASRFNRGVTSSPMPENRAASPTPKKPSLIDPPPYSKLRRQNASTSLASAPRSRQSFGGNPSNRTASYSTQQRNEPEADNRPRGDTRPGTSLGHSNRRSSLLPMPKPRSGRESSIGQRPPWK